MAVQSTDQPGCYEDVDGLRCPNRAEYEAKLHSNCAPKWLICGEHAMRFRADDDVEWIRLLDRGRVAGAAITARARGDWAAERRALDALALDERARAGLGVEPQ